MALSAGAQAARDNNYGSLANFRRISASSHYKMLAGNWATKSGLKNRRAPLAPTSRFARVYGRTYLTKDGKRRERPNQTYYNQLKRTVGPNPLELADLGES
jgi:hypothetical protein